MKARAHERVSHYASRFELQQSSFRSLDSISHSTIMPSAIDAYRRQSPSGQQDGPDYDQVADDFMRDLDFSAEQNDDNNHVQEPQKDIDEEIQVKKKRKPNPKLDEARLLSHNGVPKLRRLAKSKLKFRGKGYEYADISTLLNTYQLWLDDLYPKAKFKDGLAMVEKVGHTKRMQITRKAWLDAAKPHGREESPERLGDLEMSGGLGDAPVADGDAALNSASAQQSGLGTQLEMEDAPEEDELDALLAENATAGQARASHRPPPAKGPFEEDSDPEDDELDALLAEHDRSIGISHDVGTSKVVQSRPGDVDDFADDEEAMASIGW